MAGFPTFIGAGSAANGTGSVSPTIHASSQAGDLLVLFAESENQDISMSSGGWTQISTAQGTGTAGNAAAVRLEIFYKIHSGSESSPTVADSGDHTSAIVLTFRGVNQASPIDVAAGDTAASSTSVSCPSVTTTKANTLVVNAVAGSQDTTTGQAGSWANANLGSVTERADAYTTQADGGGISIATGTKASAGSTGNTTATLSNASAQARITFAIAPAPDVLNVLPAALNLRPLPVTFSVDQVQEIDLISSFETFGTPTDVPADKPDGVNPYPFGGDTNAASPFLVTSPGVTQGTYAFEINQSGSTGVLYLNNIGVIPPGATQVRADVNNASALAAPYGAILSNESATVIANRTASGSGTLTLSIATAGLTDNSNVLFGIVSNTAGHTTRFDNLRFTDGSGTLIQLINGFETATDSEIAIPDGWTDDESSLVTLPFIIAEDTGFSTDGTKSLRVKLSAGSSWLIYRNDITSADIQGIQFDYDELSGSGYVSVSVGNDPGSTEYGGGVAVFAGYSPDSGVAQYFFEPGTDLTGLYINIGFVGPIDIKIDSLISFEPGASYPNGSMAATEAGDGMSASGYERMTGTMAKTEVGDTMSGAGALTFTGTSARTEANDTMSASGLERMTGTAAPTDAADTMNASGSELLSGSSTASEANDTSSASGAEIFTGTSSPTEQNDTMAASGLHIEPVSGSTSASENADTMNAAGLELIGGTLDQNEAADTMAASGTSQFEGTAASTEASDTMSASGAEIMTGAVAVTDAPDTMAASGSELIPGASSANENNDTMNASAVLTIAGSSSWSENADTMAAVAVLDFISSGAVTEANDTGAAEGLLTIAGNAPATEPPDTMNASGTLTIFADSSAQELFDFMVAVALVEFLGSASWSEASDTISSAGLVAYDLAGSITEAADTMTANGILTIMGAAAIQELNDTMIFEGFTPIKKRVYLSGRIAKTFEGDWQAVKSLSMPGSIKDSIMFEMLAARSVSMPSKANVRKTLQGKVKLNDD